MVCWEETLNWDNWLELFFFLNKLDKLKHHWDKQKHYKVYTCDLLSASWHS